LDSLSLTDEHREAVGKFELLKDSLAEYEEEKEKLLFHVKPHLESLYLKLVGKNKVELLELQTEVYFLKRKMELIQSSINRGKPILLDVIEVALEAEMKEKYDRLKKESVKLEQAIQFLIVDKLNADEEQELKKLYYKLAKALHPDLNPSLTNDQINLWQKVSEAFRNGDIKKLRLIEILVEENSAETHPTVSTLEELKNKISKASQYISQLINQIETIKTSFPFSLVDKLNDPKWVIAENNASLNAISSLLDERDYYSKSIIKLTEATK
jgi:hypothetical protein